MPETVDLLSLLRKMSMPPPPKGKAAEAGFKKGAAISGEQPVDMETLIKMVQGVEVPQTGQALSPNTNVKKILPDGAVEFFDDSLVAQQALGGGQAAPAAGIAQVPQQQVQAVDVGTPQAPAPPVAGVPTGGLQEAAVLPQQGGGFFDKLSEAFNDPGTIRLLAELGKAFSAGSPRSPQFQIGSMVGKGAEAQIFQDFVNQLIGQENPEIPVVGSGLSKLSIAGLSPELQQAAVGQVMQANQQKRDFQSQNITDALRMAQISKLLTPEQEEALKFPTATQNLKILSDGRRAPAGLLYKMAMDPLTGDYTKFQGFIPDTSLGKDGADGKPIELKQFQLDEIKEGLITVFFDEAKRGLANLYGKEIADAGALLSALSNPLSGIDMTMVRIAIASESPESIQKFNRLFADAAQEILGGERNLPKIIERITGQKITADIDTIKPIAGFGANRKK